MRTPEEEEGEAIMGSGLLKVTQKAYPQLVPSKFGFHWSRQIMLRVPTAAVPSPHASRLSLTPSFLHFHLPELCPENLAN